MEDEGVQSDPATTFTLIINAHAACNDAENCFDAYAKYDLLFHPLSCAAGQR
jgi:hypothetical protein